ncbi:MAG: tetratricopeptide repeat protein [Deltaproteobacteria bacterium]|nr:tetratricopeptide repeat protein [Deltaproteobacteria bacterium]
MKRLIYNQALALLYLLLWFEPSAEQANCAELAAKINDKLKLGNADSESEQLLNELIQKCPKATEGHYNLALIKLNQGNFSEALSIAKRGLDLGKNEKLNLVFLLAAMRMNNKDEFQTVYSLASKSTKEALLDQARSVEEAHFLTSFFDPSSACGYLRLALRFNLNDFILKNYQYCNTSPLKEFYSTLADKLGKRQLSVDGLKNLSVVDLTVFTNLELARYLEILVELSAFDHAELIFRRLSKLEPSSELMCLGSYIMANQKKVNESRQFYQSGCASKVCFDLCARSAFLNDDLQDARVFLEKALELDKSDAKLTNFLGVVHRALGNKKESKELFKRALELDPNLEEARFNLNLG